MSSRYRTQSLIRFFGFHPTFLCRLGLHKIETYREDGHGRHGGDCIRCGLGPLR